ncbi:hypothetical protein HMI56_001677 [Coelomomyces lativittatus]|nr:hypothetical protein HMI56_001677 [Coelomomyces lativittatus]
MNSSILAAIFHQEHLNGRLPKLYLTHNDNWVTELFLETKLLNALNNPVGSVSRFVS